MKKIGLDARLYSKTGVGVYIRNLLHYLAPLIPSDTQLVIYLQDEDIDRYHGSERIIKKRAPYHWHSVAEQTQFLGLLNADALDLMHFPYFSYPLLYKRPFIATVHDTILLDHKTGKASTHNQIVYEFKHLIFKQVFASQINRAKAIITPTNAVKADISRRYGDAAGNKTVVIYEGVNYELLNAQESLPSQLASVENFFMYVGNFYPHKNVERLIAAFAEIDQNYHLVLIGPNDFFTSRIKALIQSMNLEKRVIVVQNASDSELLYCYRHAKALIHPSLSEGFGLPLLEAAYVKLPIIASDIPVFHELLKDFYLPFDPRNKDSIKRSIELFLSSSPATYPPNLLDQFSFERMASQTLEIYQKCL